MSNQQTAKIIPTHRVYSVSKSGDKKSTWQEIGAAWSRKDGKGFNLTLTAHPLESAEIILRTVKVKKGVFNERLSLLALTRQDWFIQRLMRFARCYC